VNAVGGYWNDMVTVALLGTDRREPPVPPPGTFADLAADDPRATPSQRMLQQVAAVAVAQRAGVQPGPVAASLSPPADDGRPVTPPSATATWHRIVREWPVLEDEWLLTVVATGRRVAPELVVPLLTRHRTDATRHARALLATGSLGRWTVGLSPRLGSSSKKAPSPEAVACLPELAIMPELAALLGAPASEVVRAVAGGLESTQLGTTHRAVLVNFVARVSVDTLAPLARALDRVDPARSSIGLAFALADLARLRHRALTELEST